MKFAPNIDLNLQINESILCGQCGATWRVVKTAYIAGDAFYGGLDEFKHAPGSIAVIPSRDQDHVTHLEASCCPRCDPMRSATFLRPVPTRGDLRAALTTALKRWELSSPEDKNTIALMRETLLFP